MNTIPDKIVIEGEEYYIPDNAKEELLGMLGNIYNLATKIRFQKVNISFTPPTKEGFDLFLTLMEKTNLMPSEYTKAIRKVQGTKWNEGKVKMRDEDIYALALYFAVMKELSENVNVIGSIIPDFTLSNRKYFLKNSKTVMFNAGTKNSIDIGIEDDYIHKYSPKLYKPPFASFSPNDTNFYANLKIVIKDDAPVRYITVAPKWVYSRKALPYTINTVEAIKKTSGMEVDIFDQETIDKFYMASGIDKILFPELLLFTPFTTDKVEKLFDTSSASRLRLFDIGRHASIMLAKMMLLSRRALHDAMTGFRAKMNVFPDSPFEKGFKTVSSDHPLSKGFKGIFQFINDTFEKISDEKMTIEEAEELLKQAMMGKEQASELKEYFESIGYDSETAKKYANIVGNLYNLMFTYQGLTHIYSIFYLPEEKGETPQEKTIEHFANILMAKKTGYTEEAINKNKVKEDNKEHHTIDIVASVFESVDDAIGRRFGWGGPNFSWRTFAVLNKVNAPLGLSRAGTNILALAIGRSYWGLLINRLTKGESGVKYNVPYNTNYFAMIGRAGMGKSDLFRLLEEIGSGEHQVINQPLRSLTDIWGASESYIGFGSGNNLMAKVKNAKADIIHWSVEEAQKSLKAFASKTREYYPDSQTSLSTIMEAIKQLDNIKDLREFFIMIWFLANTNQFLADFTPYKSIGKTSRSILSIDEYVRQSEDIEDIPEEQLPIPNFAGALEKMMGDSGLDLILEVEHLFDNPDVFNKSIHKLIKRQIENYAKGVKVSNSKAFVNKMLQIIYTNRLTGDTLETFVAEVLLPQVLASVYSPNEITLDLLPFSMKWARDISIAGQVIAEQKSIKQIKVRWDENKKKLILEGEIRDKSEAIAISEEAEINYPQKNDFDDVPEL